MRTKMNFKTLRLLLLCALFSCFSLSGIAANYQDAPEWVTSKVTVSHLEQRFFNSAAAKTKVSYYVYTPDAYKKNKEQYFPVIYWLHGGGGGVRHLAPAVKHFNRAIQNGKIPPVIVIFPHGMAESNWCNSKNGKVPMETVVINELIPHVDSTFRTVSHRKGRLIEGFSMGGYGAARLGIKYNDLFGAISIFSGGPLQRELNKNDGPPQSARARVKIMRTVYGNDQDYFKAQSPWVLAEKNADGLREKGTMMRIVVGSKDRLLSMNKDFSDRLSNLSIPHDFRVLPGVGHHPMATFKALGDINWNFYRSFLGVNELVSQKEKQKPGFER